MQIIYSNLGLNITLMKQINYLPVLFQRPLPKGEGRLAPLVTGTLHGIWLHGHVRLDSHRAGDNDVAVVFIVVRLMDAVDSRRRDHRRAVVGARACQISCRIAGSRDHPVILMR